VRPRTQPEGPRDAYALARRRATRRPAASQAGPSPFRPTRRSPVAHVPSPARRGVAAGLRAWGGAKRGSCNNLACVYSDPKHPFGTAVLDYEDG